MGSVYCVDGDFGKVRIAEGLFLPADEAALTCFESAGWHACNDRYRIDRPDGAPFWLLLFTVAGEGRLELEDGAYALTPGTAAVIPAGAASMYGTPPGGMWEFYWIHPCGAAAQGLCVRLRDEMRRAGVWPLMSAEKETVVFARQTEELLLLRAEGGEEAALRASQVLSGLLHGLLLAAARAGKGRGRGLSAAAIRYMEENYSRDITTAQLCAQLYISPAHFTRTFRRETGCTPHEYLTRVRVRCAGQLLRFTDRPVGDIAAAVGYRQTSHFIAQFRRITGVTPGVYRSQP